MKRFFKDKRGFISIYMILWMAVLIPILMFTFIDFSHYIYESKHLKSVTDNASASAVTQVKEDLIPSGVLEIDEVNAEAVALKLFKKDLLLNDDLTPKENSILKEKPTIQMHVVNITSETGYDFETPAGVVRIFKPSVVIYAEYPVSGLFYYKSGVRLKKVAVSQVQFKNNKVEDGDNSNSDNGGNNGEITDDAGNKSKYFNIEKSASQTQTKTVTIPNLKEVKSLKVDTGNVELISVNGNDVTVKMMNGNPINPEDPGTKYYQYNLIVQYDSK